MAAGGGGGMSRLLGLGFLFGAKDDGAVETTEKLGEGFDKVADAVDKTAGKTQGIMKFGNAINALNFLQLDRMRGAMDKLGDAAGMGPGAAANQLESFGAEFSKTFKMATAGLGKFEGAVRKYKGQIGGVAFNLGIDAGELTKTVSMLVKTGNSVEDYGLTVRGLAGAMQAGIGGGEELGKTLTALSQGYGLGAKGAGKLLDEIVAIGRQTGMGSDAINQMAGAIKAADAAIQSLPENMRPSVTETVKSLTILATATQKVLGGSYEDAFTAATDVMSKLTEGRLDLAKTFAGLGGEFPELAKRISEFGGVGQAFDAMSKDPATFVMEMQKVYATIGDAGRQTRFLDALPDSIKFMVQAGAEGSKAIAGLSGPLKDTAGAFNDMVKKSSGASRTFSEAMELMKDKYDIQWRKIAGVTAKTDKEVMQRQKAAFEKVSEAIRDQVKKGGPLGTFAEIWFRLQRYGPIQTALDMFDKLSKRGGVLGRMADQMKLIVPLFDGFGDVLVEMGPLILGAAFIIPKLAGAVSGVAAALTFSLPLTLAFAAVGLLIYKNWDTIAPILEGVSGWLFSTNEGFKTGFKESDLFFDNIDTGSTVARDGMAGLNDEVGRTDTLFADATAAVRWWIMMTKTGVKMITVMLANMFDKMWIRMKKAFLGMKFFKSWMIDIIDLGAKIISGDITGAMQLGTEIQQKEKVYDLAQLALDLDLKKADEQEEFMLKKYGLGILAAEKEIFKDKVAMQKSIDDAREKRRLEAAGRFAPSEEFTLEDIDEDTRKRRRARARRKKRTAGETVAERQEAAAAVRAPVSGAETSVLDILKPDALVRAVRSGVVQGITDSERKRPGVTRGSPQAGGAGDRT